MRLHDEVFVNFLDSFENRELRDSQRGNLAMYVTENKQKTREIDDSRQQHRITSAQQLVRRTEVKIPDNN